MNYYILSHQPKTNGILSPGLNGKTVKNYQAFFENGKCTPTTFYDKDYEFDYLIPIEVGENENEPQIIVDFHRWTGLEIPRGGVFYPISEKFKLLLKSYNLPKHKFYKARVLFKGEFHTYFVWHLLYNNYFEYLDSNKTRYNNLNYSRKLKQETLEIKQFNSPKERSDYSNKNWNYSWNYEQLVMKPSFRELDYCYVTQLGGLVSERLKEAIEAAGLTGIRFEPLPIPIEFSDEVD